MNKEIKKDCPFTDEIVSYIYEEISGSEQTVFENHLADCMKCTDEFAAISEARFSVFEWQKEEFAPLATPRIVIPYETQTASAAGWFDAVRSLLTGSMWPVAAAASIAMVIGFGLLFRSGTVENVFVVLPSEQLAPVTAPVVSTEVANNVVPSKPVSVDNEKQASVSSDAKTMDARVVKTADRRQLRPYRQLTAETVRPRTTPSNLKTTVRKAPVLSTFDDDDDKTLRLSDLFEGGIGS